MSEKVLLPDGVKPQQRRILLPNEVDDVRKKILAPDSKIYLSPMARAEAERRKAADSGELTIGRRFNHAERRWHIRFAERMRRRQVRASYRRQRRLDLATFAVATQHYDAATKQTVRLTSDGKPLKVVERPPSLDVRIPTGFMARIEFKDGGYHSPGEPLRKSKAQVEMEVNERLGVFPQAEIAKVKRQKGSFQWPKPKVKVEA